MAPFLCIWWGAVPYLPIAVSRRRIRGQVRIVSGQWRLYAMRDRRRLHGLPSIQPENPGLVMGTRKLSDLVWSVF